MLLFPRLTQLDLTGPLEVLRRLPDSQIHLLWHDRNPIYSDSGLGLLPDTPLAESPRLDIIFVPGGPGISAVLEDENVLDFLRQQGAQARYVTAVCTGALGLAAAGLLDGYRATTHWLSLDLLALFGVEVVRERVVIDRNRITGGGVTAGIDFALTLAAHLHTPQIAQEIQLMLEYAPDPPYTSGSPSTAPPEIVAKIQADRAALHYQRRQQIEMLIRRAELRKNVLS